MNNILNWKECDSRLNPIDAEVGSENEHVVYLAEFDEQSDEAIALAVQACMDKAIGFLSDNVDDESRYFLFEWNVACSTLTIVVTDDSRENDSQYVVKCLMSALDDDKKSIEYVSMIKYEIKDYLTTSSEFLKYSLVAVFHSGSRGKVDLL